MTTQTDVLSKSLTAAAGANSALLGIGGTNPALGVRIKGIYWSGTVAGSIAFNDGSSTGTTRISIAVPAATTYLTLPGEGVRFNNDVYVAFTSATGTVTVFYG
jgi:hypothetical protein